MISYFGCMGLMFVHIEHAYNSFVSFFFLVIEGLFLTQTTGLWFSPGYLLTEAQNTNSWVICPCWFKVFDIQDTVDAHECLHSNITTSDSVCYSQPGRQVQSSFSSVSHWPTLELLCSAAPCHSVALTAREHTHTHLYSVEEREREGRGKQWRYKKTRNTVGWEGASNQRISAEAHMHTLSTNVSYSKHLQQKQTLTDLFQEMSGFILHKVTKRATIPKTR